MCYCFLPITVHLLCVLRLGQLQEEAANRRDKLDLLKQANQRAIWSKRIYEKLKKKYAFTIISKEME
jgi:hypothetical protein